MLRTALVITIGLAGCEKQAPDPSPAPAPADARAAEASPPAAERASWWETDSPCPDGAALKKQSGDRHIQCFKEDGTAHGPVVFLHDNGKKRIEGRYVDGKRDGIWSQWNREGELLGTFSMTAGSGTLHEWYESGDPRLEVTYKDGERSGPYREYHEGRKLRWQRAYQDGVPVGGWQQWSTEGKLLGSLTFSGGSGRFVEWNDDGTTYIEGRFQGGKQHGTWTWKWAMASEGGEPTAVEYRRRYQRGKVVSLRIFKNGKPVEDADDARALARKRAEHHGVFASLTGTADFASGLDEKNVYGGLIGNEVGEMSGGFGVGGSGGGGTGWGTIGTGRYGTIGHGSGTGAGYGTGSGRGGMRGRKATRPSVRIGSATATGDLDKNIIRRYIRRKLPQITYCYEKQLLVNQGLAGTLVANFVISATGSVVSAKASGIHDQVATCVAGVIKSIQFPKPKGGGIVQVRYPFTFRGSGG